MNYALIVSIDIADEHRPQFEAWLRSSFLDPSKLPGFGADPACFRGVRVETRYRTYIPSPSYLVIFDLLDEPAKVFGSDEFFEWWTEGVRARFGWVQRQNWIAAQLVAGPPPPFDCNRALITQVDLPLLHQNGWARWYDEVHIPQSQKVPDFFRAENRRFSAIDLKTPRWHCAPHPSFVHFVPIKDGADILRVSALPEYLDLMVDTQARWAGTMQSAVSTICERFQ